MILTGKHTWKITFSISMNLHQSCFIIIWESAFFLTFLYKHIIYLPNLPEHHDEHAQRQSMCQSRQDDTKCPRVPNDRRTPHKHEQARCKQLHQAGLHILLIHASLSVCAARASFCRCLSHLSYCEDLGLRFRPRHSETLSVTLALTNTRFCIWGILPMIPDRRFFFNLRPHLHAIVCTPQSVGFIRRSS